MQQIDFEKLKVSLIDRYGPFFARSRVVEVTGGGISGRYMANLDSLGKGPPSFRVGRKKFYPTDAFADWYFQRV